MEAINESAAAGASTGSQYHDDDAAGLEGDFVGDMQSVDEEARQRMYTLFIYLDSLLKMIQVPTLIQAWPVSLQRHLLQV
jgi:hypothetical protein